VFRRKLKHVYFVRHVRTLLCILFMVVLVMVYSPSSYLLRSRKLNVRKVVVIVGMSRLYTTAVCHLQLHTLPSSNVSIARVHHFQTAQR